MGHKRDAILPPVLSSEHGATVTLLVTFAIGAWLAGDWNLGTTVALTTSIAIFLAQAPMTRLVRRRKFDLRHSFWMVAYGVVGVWGAVWLVAQNLVLIRIYSVAAVVVLINLLSVGNKDQKSVVNELSAFAGLCLALPLAYTATLGMMTSDLLGLWLLSSFVLASAVFTVRIRLFGEKALAQTAAYHITILALGLLLVRVGLLPAALAWTLAIPILKTVLIILAMDRYRQMKLTSIGFTETGLAILFGVWVALVG